MSASVALGLEDFEFATEQLPFLIVILFDNY